MCSQPRRRGTPVGQGYHRPSGRRRGALGRSAPGRGAGVPRIGACAGRDRGASPRGPAPALRERLEATGVTELYSHQAAAWEATRRGEHVAITTGTASGKSLAFNLPVLGALTEEPKHRALYLYPTKALSQDQVRALGALRVKNVRAAIYDGDTEGERRWQIRKWSNLILTNPDMLHVGVLPHHDRWGDVLSNLRYVVVDEAHVYRGRVRLARGQRPAAAAEARARVRSRTAVPARLRDDREPGRARDLADGPRVHGPRPGRCAEGGANDRALEPAADRRGAGPACERARGGVEADGRPRRARPAHARVREEPPLGRADPQVHGRSARQTPPGSRRTEPATRPRSAARSSSASSPASSSV